MSGKPKRTNPQVTRLMDSGNIAELLMLIERKFECKRCGDCCRIGGGIVRVSQDEIEEIAELLGMEVHEFIEEHTSLAPDRRGLVLNDAPDGACEMLDEDGSCIIYEARPSQCRSFPYEWVNKDSFEECPGLAALLEL